jgi:hypothetical protein
MSSLGCWRTAAPGTQPALGGRGRPLTPMQCRLDALTEGGSGAFPGLECQATGYLARGLAIGQPTATNWTPGWFDRQRNERQRDGQADIEAKWKGGLGKEQYVVRSVTKRYSTPIMRRLRPIIHAATARTEMLFRSLPRARSAAPPVSPRDRSSRSSVRVGRPWVLPRLVRPAASEKRPVGQPTAGYCRPRATG